MQNSQNYLTKIVTLLNDGQFHYATDLSQRLNISLIAIWNTIQKLKKHKLLIVADGGKRYRLQKPLILLDLKKIKKSVRAKSLHIDLFEQIDSTNEYLKRAIPSQKLNVCLAETQTQGKGRFQRQWYSPFGQNIYLSLKYTFSKDISELTGLSLVCGLAICNAIEKSCQLSKPIFIKWPNDIMCKDKKLAGILIEVVAETHRLCSAIIGIGLNTNMEKDDRKITKHWISLKNLTTIDHDRNKLCIMLINCLIDFIKCFENQGLNRFLSSWKKRDYLLDKHIRLKSGLSEFQGKSLCINGQGHLVISLSDGSQRVFSSGDATLLQT